MLNHNDDSIVELENEYSHDYLASVQNQHMVMRNCLNEMGAPGAVRLITNNMPQELFNGLVKIAERIARKFGHQHILEQLEFVGLIYGA